MAVIVHLMAGIQRNLDRHAVLLHIHNAVRTPALFSKHNLLINRIYKRLDVGALLLIGHQDALRARRNHEILAAHYQDRNSEFVDHMNVGTGFVQPCVTDRTLFHGLSQCVPCAEVFPGAAIAQDFNTRLLLDYSVVEGNLAKVCVSRKQRLIVAGSEEFIAFAEDVAQLVSKYATVPKSPCSYILLGLLFCRLFREPPAPLSILLHGLDIAILLGRIGRLNTHKNKVF